MEITVIFQANIPVHIQYRYPADTITKYCTLKISGMTATYTEDTKSTTNNQREITPKIYKAD